MCVIIATECDGDAASKKSSIEQAKSNNNMRQPNSNNKNKHYIPHLYNISHKSYVVSSYYIVATDENPTNVWGRLRCICTHEKQRIAVKNKLHLGSQLEFIAEVFGEYLSVE